MPMRRMLEGGTFDPKAVSILLEVFETVTTELGLRDMAPFSVATPSVKSPSIYHNCPRPGLHAFQRSRRGVK